jgi:hypothetical protein
MCAFLLEREDSNQFIQVKVEMGRLVLFSFVHVEMVLFSKFVE